MEGTPVLEKHRAGSQLTQSSAAPQTAPPRLYFRVPPEPSHLLRARERVRDYLRQYCTDDTLIDEVVLCLEEAAANAIRHSGSDQDIELSLGFKGGELVCAVKDRGRGFDVASFDREALPDLLSDHGRGLFIIAKLMDSLELTADGGLEVRMSRSAEPSHELPPVHSGLGEPRPAETVRRRDHRTRAMLEELGEGFLALDWEYRCVYANKEALRIGRNSLDEILGRTPWEAVPGLEGSPLQAQYRQAMELGRPSIFEYRSVVSGDWLEVRAYPTPAGISVYYRDINERKRNEHERELYLAALHESEERFRSLFESMTEGVALHELVYEDGCAVDYRILDVNASYESQTGVTAQNARGRLASDLYGTGGAPYLSEYARVAEGGGPYSFETYFEPMERHFRITAVSPAAGRFATVFEDITERKQAEDVLRASEWRLRRFYEAGLVGVVYWNTAGQIVEANDRFLEMVGYTRDELAAGEIDWVNMTPPELRYLDERSLAELKATGQNAAPFEKEYLRKDGTRLPIILAGAMLDEKRRDGVAFVLDISERKKVEKEREQLLKDVAARASFSTALNQIAASITSLLGYDEILDAAVARAGAAVGAESATMASLEAESWVPHHLWHVPASVLDVPIPREQVAYANIAVETKAAVAVDDCETDPRVDIQLQHEWGVRSVMTVPLVVRGKVIGGLFFNYHSAPHCFTELEIDFAKRVADLVSGMLEGARLFEAQRRIAQTLQENFIHPLPAVAGLEFGVVSSTAYEPDLVGGDFSDVVLLDDTHVVVLIGDVAGKGVRAAGHTETVRSKVRAFASIDASPAFILAKTNELQLRFDPDDPHVTAFCAVLDPTTGHLSYASAGHPAPVHLGAFSARLLDVPFGPPLGTFECPYTNAHTMLTLEDYLVFYTDGVTEARGDGEFFGEQRLLQVVSGLRGGSAQEVAEGVRDAVLAFAGRLRDDLLVVVLRLG